jgi:hypothetical protein
MSKYGGALMTLKRMKTSVKASLCTLMMIGGIAVSGTALAANAT